MQINISKNTKAGTAITQFLQFYNFQLYTFRSVLSLINRNCFAIVDIHSFLCRLAFKLASEQVEPSASFANR